jgi:hypothetical protein
MLGHHDFGQQNTAEGHEQMDYALERVNFWTQPRCILFLHVRKPTGILKELLEPGSKKTGRREEVVLASKIRDLTLTFICMREE